MRSLVIGLIAVGFALTASYPTSDHDASAHENECRVRRAALDIGSTTTRLHVADVNRCEGRLLQSVLRAKERNALDVERVRGTSVMSSGTVATAAAIVQNMTRRARAAGAVEVVAVGTSAFRDAANGKQAAATISGSGSVPVLVITPREEAKFHWYAQDDAGNVWYLGEEVDNYNYDDQGQLIDIDHEGSWEAGLDVAGAGTVAQPGIVMHAAPEARTSYRQKFYATKAEDMAFIVRTDARVELSDGSVYENCIQTLDWVPLDPSALEFKFYAQGVGMVMETSMDGEEVVELVAKN